MKNIRNLISKERTSLSVFRDKGQYTKLLAESKNSHDLFFAIINGVIEYNE